MTRAYPPNARLLLLDLDGTVRRCTVEGQPCPNRRGEQALLAGAVEGIRRAFAEGLNVAFVTNQAGIGLGIMSKDDFYDILDELDDLLGLRDYNIYTYYCPHKPKAGCACRKPKPGMLLDAMRHFKVEPREVLFIGDMESDRQAAMAAMCLFADAWAWRSIFTEKES